jgi:hypothetical protein
MSVSLHNLLSSDRSTLHNLRLDIIKITRCLCLKSQSQNQKQSYVTTDDQSASLSWCQAPICDSGPNFYFCQTVAGLLMWGALSDERTGLPSTMYNIFTFYMLLHECICTIYTRPVQAQYNRSCPILSSFRL